MKFVEAQKPRVLEDRCRGELNGVGVGHLTPRDALAKGKDALMHVRHELMEMDPAFVGDPALLEEQVHQHGFAAPDVTMDIKSLRRRYAVGMEKLVEEARLACGLVGHEPLVQRGKSFHRPRLRGVRLDRA
jgi:hypothetical protein